MRARVEKVDVLGWNKSIADYHHTLQDIQNGLNVCTHLGVHMVHVASHLQTLPTGEYQSMSHKAN